MTSFPNAASGLIDNYKNVAIGFQLEKAIEPHILTAYGTYIRQNSALRLRKPETSSGSVRS